MDSQVHPQDEDTQEQPLQVDSNAGEQPDLDSQAETVEIDGEQVPIDELKAGYLRQSDYTRKTKELAAQREEVENARNQFVRNETPPQDDDLDPDVMAAAETLKKAGFVTKQELEILEKKQTDERRLEQILDANPDLRSKEALIRAVGKTDNRAWEDIITDSQYGLKESGKLLKAKARDVKGMPAPKEPPKQKTLSQMDRAEYAQWKKENLGKQQF